jgi:transcriptional antiterminator RfaH
MPRWYLLRTKVGEERRAQQQLQGSVEATLLPLGKTLVPQHGRMIERIAPLFPCYLFAFFALSVTARKIRYTPGVRNLVRFGEEVAIVPRWVIDELTKRCRNGPVELAKNRFSDGGSVPLVDEPAGQLLAVFDGYLSGAERVAVLLSVMSTERRVQTSHPMLVAAQ